MDITDVRVRNVAMEGKLKAYVTVTFDDAFVVHNVKVIEGDDGVFIAMPSRKTKKGEYKDVAHPINTDFRGALQERIISEYNKHINDAPIMDDNY
ncbi:septation regulator SpoVG [Entomospira entomophila]|uniref:Putative septation protein SpoVG n=1 Tax=Entomospira entomophila TaxID=2719988 RepID=A0A968KRK4_9SPIO|nr:septation regulator SpoVG [Entomospira entomophilus]NIZ40843.1 septation regulator SpoVG [Entomospira entomophilus]WDI35055.1 septation regulator SpoVG [Entomospira entomophilus]